MVGRGDGWCRFDRCHGAEDSNADPRIGFGTRPSNCGRCGLCCWCRCLSPRTGRGRRCRRRCLRSRGVNGRTCRRCGRRCRWRRRRCPCGWRCGGEGQHRRPHPARYPPGGHASPRLRTFFDLHGRAPGEGPDNCGLDGCAASHVQPIDGDGCLFLGLGDARTCDQRSDRQPCPHSLTHAKPRGARAGRQTHAPLRGGEKVTWHLTSPRE